MRTADSIVLMNWEGDRRLAGLRRSLEAAIDYLAYAIHFDLPRVNADAEQWSPPRRAPATERRE